MRTIGSIAGLQEALSSLSTHFKKCNDVENFRLILALDSALMQLVDMLQEASLAYKTIGSSYSHLLYNLRELLTTTQVIHAALPEGELKETSGRLLAELRNNPGIKTLDSQGRRFALIAANETEAIKDKTLAAWIAAAPYSGEELAKALDREMDGVLLEPPVTNAPDTPVLPDNMVATIRKLVQGSYLLWGTQPLPPFLEEGKALLDQLEKMDG